MANDSGGLFGKAYRAPGTRKLQLEAGTSKAIGALAKKNKSNANVSTSNKAAYADKKAAEKKRKKLARGFSSNRPKK